ncbi:hypothetical protein PUN49_07990 [Pseudomonas extremaustralis]|uniref:hypothetical protein n=1 Tax=Pseudomonas extremaustralis TaxID=359110 RepID=UPI0021C859B9|nr:hypothetical protein [Pseudomonas extremaustralis]MDB1109949.1 hypothetical protein [Pseudomonas extremaustralis]MDG2966973.1 hypothetical protein [Pseudomonas extremaustralis]UUJ40434.1 hypothetical protein L1A22_27795 [Pseudomonas extremaustralis]
MLAKNVNDDAGILKAWGALGFFASKLAPTGSTTGLPMPLPFDGSPAACSMGSGGVVLTGSVEPVMQGCAYL